MKATKAKSREMLKAEDCYALHLPTLINFYDAFPESSKGHAAAINAIMGEELAAALLADYFVSKEGAEVTVVTPCTQGTQSGKRLDIWLIIRKANSTVIYQVEIKNWSAHSIGGRCIPKDADEAALCEHRIGRWHQRWDASKMNFTDKEARKVLIPMKVPISITLDEQKILLRCKARDGTQELLGVPEVESYKKPIEEMQIDEHKAMMCFWDPMHKDGGKESMFDVRTSSKEFSTLTVFSLSNYVRLLIDEGQDILRLELPQACARLNWLGKILHMPMTEKAIR